MQISFDRLFAKNLQFFRKTSFPYVKCFQKAKFYQNLTSGSGSKQRFSLLQAKGHSGSVPEDSGSKYKRQVFLIQREGYRF